MHPFLDNWAIMRGASIPVMRERTDGGPNIFLAAVFMLAVNFFVVVVCTCEFAAYVRDIGT